jgi:hypothetical protein
MLSNLLQCNHARLRLTARGPAIELAGASAPKRKPCRVQHTAAAAVNAYQATAALQSSEQRVGFGSMLRKAWRFICKSAWLIALAVLAWGCSVLAHNSAAMHTSRAVPPAFAAAPFASASAASAAPTTVRHDRPAAFAAASTKGSNFSPSKVAIYRLQKVRAAMPAKSSCCSAYRLFG